MSMLMSALGRGRNAANARMTEDVTVGEYEDGVDANGDATRSLVETRYTGKGRVKYPTVASTTDTDTSQVVIVQKPVLSVPTGSARLLKGDEVHVAASSADSALVGRRYRVAGAPQSGQTTAHRYELVEIS